MNKLATVQQQMTTSLLPPAQGLLQRQCACGNRTAAGGECTECAKKKHNLQRKLSIGASNDPLEHEADRVADQVMSMQPNATVNKAPVRIQRYSGQTNQGEGTAPASVNRVLSSAGRPLEPSLRNDMEQRFGHDFSHVQVHTGETAEQSAKDVNAKAYTVGSNVVFGAGQYAPQTQNGKRLLAHELTHVVQQSGSDRASVDQGGEINSLFPVFGGALAASLPDSLVATGAVSVKSTLVMRQTEPPPNLAEYQWVNIQKGGTWDAVAILSKIGQREKTDTRIVDPQPVLNYRDEKDGPVVEHRQSDDYRCGPNAVLASAITQGPIAVRQLCVNLYKRIIEWRDKSAAERTMIEQRRHERMKGTHAPELAKTLPSPDYCQTAATSVFNIHWSLDSGIRFGSHEGGGNIMTYADFDRLAGHLYTFTFDNNIEWRSDVKAETAGGASPEQEKRLREQYEKQKAADRASGKVEQTWKKFLESMRIKSTFRTESEIGDAAKMAGYEDDPDVHIRRVEVTDWSGLNSILQFSVPPGDTMIGMWGPHTYTFIRMKDRTLYLYDSWSTPAMHPEGTEEYKTRIEKGLTGDQKPIVLLQKLRRSHFN